MLRLRVWNSAEDAQFDIELYTDAPVNLKYQFTDVSKVNQTVGSYSQTFRIPATQNNLKFFGGLVDPNVVETSDLINDTFNIKRKIRAELLYNTVPLMNGFVQIKAIYRQKKEFNDIELVFFGEAVQLSAAVGNALLSDLDLTALEHELNILNLQTSWVASGSTPFDGTIRYGVMDKGQNWNGDQTDGLWSNTNRLKQTDLTPYLQVKWLLTKILSEAGFTYSSTFIDSADFANAYMPMYNGSVGILSDDIADNTCLTGLASDQTTTSDVYELVSLVDTATGGKDPNGNWTNSTTYKYTAPADVFVFIRMFSKGDNVNMAIFKNGDTGTNVLQVVSIGSEYVIESQNYTGIYLESGDTLQAYVKRYLPIGTGTLYGNNQTTGTYGNYFEVWQVTDPVSGIDVDPNLNLPEFKQIDYISSLQKMYNLVFIPDKLNPTKLYIEPFKDYIATGTEKDWTNKIDFSKDIVIKPTTDLQKAKYVWSHAEGQDYINDAIFRQLGRVYGEYKLLDPINDFARGEEKTQTGLAPYVMSLIPNTGVPIHRCIRADGTGVQKPKPRIAYWNGMVNNLITWYIQNDSGTGVSSTTFPLFSNYSDTLPEVTSNDLNFGWEIPLIPHEAHPVNNLYYKYWAGYVNELYSSTARTLECWMKLTAEDIATFEFNDKIYIENSYYRILNISAFDATVQAPCKVTLLKILADIPDCADLPTNSTSNGIVTFNGSYSDYGSKTCCEKYGYVWTPDKVGGNSRCRALGAAFVPEQ